MISDKITEITNGLTWQIVHVKGDRDLEITSNPWEKTHTISIPAQGADWREIEYLHELAHAVLAEKHHLLATAWFGRSVAKSAYFPLVNPIRVASDWFADDLLMRWCPVEETAEIREHADYALAYHDHDPVMIYGGGLSLAQCVKYLGDKAYGIPRRYRMVTNALLAVDPSKPTAKAKEYLINLLAAITCGKRVRLTHEENKDVWQVV